MLSGQIQTFCSSLSVLAAPFDVSAMVAEIIFYTLIRFYRVRSAIPYPTELFETGRTICQNHHALGLNSVQTSSADYLSGGYRRCCHNIRPAAFQCALALSDHL